MSRKIITIIVGIVAAIVPALVPLPASASDGAGVNAYVIDTGIRFTHVDFGGRAHPLIDTVRDGRNGADCNGHGTGMAGRIGGAQFGAAPLVNLFSVRVLNCVGSGSLSGVVAGVNFVAQNAGHPAVANIGLGGGISQTLDSAVARMIASGVVTVVTAGFGPDSGCNTSPARVPAAITVAGGDVNGMTLPGAGFGPCVDLVAPGVNIQTDWSTSDTATNVISGSSIAAAYVAGVAADYLSDHPTATQAEVRTALLAMAAPSSP